MKTWVNYISDPVRNKIKASVKVGEDWLDNLDKLINKLEEEWKIKVIKVLEDGTHTFIGEAVTQNKQKVILKLSMPEMIGETEFEHEIKALKREFSTLISKKTMDIVLMVCEFRLDAFTPEKPVLVHGDPHNANLLQALDSNEFKLIDPDGIFCEPAYDLGVLMREWPDELVDNPIIFGEKRCEFLSKLTNVESQPIWEWGLIQAIATGLLLVKIGQNKEGLRLLKIADSWANYF